MLQKYSRWKILQVFFDDPEANFQLREISRKAGIAVTSVKMHLKALSEEGLIAIEPRTKRKYPAYFANRMDNRFRLLKKINTVLTISYSGLLNYLNDKYMPDAIVLFGSAAKGEDTKDSDLDLFLLCSEKSPDLGKFEKALGRKISIFYSEDLGKLGSELKNNIINGIVLKGYLKVF
ncbi:MAG: nucleotidyltransferase domain-containing protein [Candidatus Aenigmatarchaeota archaeon]